MTKKPRSEGINDNAVFLGVILGLLIGGIAALLGAPPVDKQTRQRIKDQRKPKPDKQKLKNTIPIDPAADSIAIGKAAARRRMEELGLNK